MFDAIRKGLTDSYKHKAIDGSVCVACGRKGVPFALHVIEFYHSDDIATPSYLVPMSQSRGIARGAVPLCNTCCPACKDCSLPIATPWIKRLLSELNTKHQGINFVVGNGLCRHVHIVKDLMSFFRSAKLASVDVQTYKAASFSGKTAVKSLTEEAALRAYAKMMNTLNAEYFAPLLADDFTYESQQVFQPLESKQAFLNYIYPKLKTIQQAGATVFAEMGTIVAYGKSQHCVILAQNEKSNLVGLVLAKTDGTFLKRLDLCIVPTPQAANRSGEYPT